jgi:hypothetical protein
VDHTCAWRCRTNDHCYAAQGEILVVHGGRDQVNVSSSKLYVHWHAHAIQVCNLCHLAPHPPGLPLQNTLEGFKHSLSSKEGHKHH